MAPAVDPAQILREGASILSEVLAPAGFEFSIVRDGVGSGGHFASGAFTRGDRQLQLHFRESLGLVTYRIADLELDHVTYLRYLGCYGRHSYPGFGSDPLDGFRHLAHDLGQHFQDFLRGAGDQFRLFARQHEQNPRRFTGLRATQI